MADDLTLVTGAAGFVGGHLIDRLAGRGPLVGWYRPGGMVPASRPQVDWQAVDVTDGTAVARAFDGIRPSRVFHLAGAASVATSWQESALYLRTNALGTHHLLRAVRASAHPCRVLVVSSAMIYQASEEPLNESAPLVPSTPYGLSKLAQDHLALRAAVDDNMDVVVARPFNHIGPQQTAAYATSSFARQIARIEAGLDPAELRVGNLEARRDITDVRDVTAAYECLMHKAISGRAYNVCSGRVWRARDLLDELLHSSTTPVRVALDPARLRPADVPIVQGDAGRIRAEVGWVPSIPVEQSIRDMLDWWRTEVRTRL